MADDFVSDSWPPPKNGKNELSDSTARMAKSLDQIHFKIKDMIAETDRVVVRLTAGARQIGEFTGMPPTNRSYEVGEIHIFRLRDGRIVEHWHQIRRHGHHEAAEGRVTRAYWPDQSRS